MKREIKFRALCETDEGIEMVYFEPMTFDNGLWFQAMQKHINEHISPPLQFTGLKDINGKDIYEGDFIKLHEYGDDVYKEVEFRNGSFCIHGFNWNKKTAEVIGNIYENPELL